MATKTYWFPIVCFFLLFFDFCSSFFDIDELKTVHYGLDIASEPVVVTEEVPVGAIELMSKYGQQYRCSFPDHNIQDKEKEEQEKVAMETGILQLLKPLESSDCLFKTKDWWSYEFCYGKYIRQYHAEDGVIKGEIIYLGHYESDFDWNNETKKDERLKSKSSFFRYHSQTYTNGSKCDLTQTPRKSEVRFLCEEGSTDYIARIDEPQTCVYIITINTARICSHPYLKPIAPKKPVSITCNPLLSTEEYQEYLLEVQVEQKRKEEEAEKARLEEEKRKQVQALEREKAKQVEDKDGNLDSPTSSVKSDRVETYLTNTLTKELKIVQDRLAVDGWNQKMRPHVPDAVIDHMNQPHKIGHSESTTSHSESTTGRSESSTGHSESTGYSESTTGHSESTTGHSESTTGHSKSTTGRSESTTGHSVPPSGHSESKTGHSESPKGKVKSTTHQTDQDTRQPSVKKVDSSHKSDSDHEDTDESEMYDDFDKELENVRKTYKNKREQFINMKDKVRTVIESQFDEIVNEAEESLGEKIDKTEAFQQLSKTLNKLIHKLEDTEKDLDDVNKVLDKSLLDDAAADDAADDDTPTQEPGSNLEAPPKSEDRIKVRVTRIKSGGVLKEEEEIPDKTRKQLEDTVKSGLEKAGLDTGGGKIQVKIITSGYYNADDDSIHILSEEESASFQHLIVAVLGGSNEAAKEEERQRKLENNYSKVWSRKMATRQETKPTDEE